MEKRSSPWRRSSEMAPQTMAILMEYAIGLLARRDYSVAELHDRLGRRTEDGALIESVIDNLQQQGLQSDTRFAEVFVRSRISRRHGPRRILNELMLKGIEGASARAALQAAGTDWYALACEALAARFSTPGNDLREKAKRQRFLAGRGFDGDQTRHALSCAWSPEMDN
ncbi:regulatory protein RecX [Zymobacter sp. IVIA_5232.4 C2]|uniref:regulatory protein RecX n=1 Tax=Zymobacter sp. IVIA_5232.4 C2 TaxID=3394855 RepID=UPI0039C3A2F6